MWLLALALMAAGCSGPESASPSATTAATATAVLAAPTASLPTLATATSAPAAPTATVSAPTATSAPDAAICADGVELLGKSDALDKLVFDNDDVGGLSALAWAGAGSAYYALSDRGGRAYQLDFPAPGDPTITAEFRLRNATGEPDNSIDGEGLAVLPNGDLLATSEVEPAIRQYTSDGEYVADLPVPERFLVAPAGQAAGNGTFESLALSPSGQALFTAVEQPLEGDGTQDDGRKRIRILRYDLIDGAVEPAAEYFYLAEADQGVAELAAISDDKVLVLERGLSLLTGFSARVYVVVLDGAEDVSAIDQLEESDATPVGKELLVDVNDCPPGADGSVGGINMLLENFESLALGPPQSDGRYTLITGSDDNFQSFQVTRYLVFAIDLRRF